MKTIAVIDDDIHIGDMISEVLTGAGYAVVRAYSGSEAMLLFEKTTPDLVLLDLMLPGISGDELLPKIRNIPTIIVSAKIGIEDKVSLLHDGAVDYITKPFHIKELLARIEVALRTRSTASADVLRCGEISIDTLSHLASVGGQPLNLTKTEYAVLKVLVQNPNRVIAKSVLLDRISSDTLDCTESSLKTHISHLRAKLRESSGKETIESVWGIGFKLTCE